MYILQLEDNDGVPSFSRYQKNECWLYIPSVIVLVEVFPKDGKNVDAECKCKCPKKKKKEVYYDVVRVIGIVCSCMNNER
jgi:hypothetical protein